MAPEWTASHGALHTWLGLSRVGAWATGSCRELSSWEHTWPGIPTSHLWRRKRSQMCRHMAFLQHSQRMQ